MHIRQHPLLSPSLGSQRLLTSFHFGPADCGRKIYIQASLHADELPGMLTAWHLKRRLLQLETDGVLTAEIVLVPVANPIGLAQRVTGQPLGRFELDSGQNFNRHYPSLAAEAFARVRDRLGDDAGANTRLIRRTLPGILAGRTARSELESLRLTLLALAIDAEIVLDLHCDARAEVHVFTIPQMWSRCEPLARYLGACASLLATESGDQPFDEACSTLWLELAELAARETPDARIVPSCMAATVELRGEADVSHALAEQDAEALLHYLCAAGAIDRPAPPAPPLRHPATPLAGSADLCAPHAGMVVYLARPGDALAIGDPVAEVIDPLTDRVSTVRAAAAGVLYATANRPYAVAGMLLGKLATPEAFKRGKLLTA